MDTVQLDFIAKKYCTNFNGTLAADEIQGGKDGFYIVNTGKKNTPGLHWVVFNLNSTCSEYFDSSALKPWSHHKHWHKILLSHSPSYKYNANVLQAANSTTCGQYCLYYLVQRQYGVPYEEIVQSLSGNPQTSEKKVVGFLSKLIKESM